MGGLKRGFRSWLKRGFRLQAMGGLKRGFRSWLKRRFRLQAMGGLKRGFRSWLWLLSMPLPHAPLHCNSLRLVKADQGLKGNTANSQLAQGYLGRLEGCKDTLSSQQRRRLIHPHLRCLSL
jgi:hypothetical protein